MTDPEPKVHTSMPYHPALSIPEPESPSEEDTNQDSSSQRADDSTTGKTDDNKSNKEERETPESDEKDKDEEEKKDTEKPLLEEETVKIDIHSDNEGEDTPTLPLPDKKKKSIEELDGKKKAKLPKYLFPFTRIKNAWNKSENVFQFVGQATCIIFQTVGWFTCVGGIPFFSLVMLIIGSIYVHDCKIEPNIPVYLIVSGVIGTIQHFLSIWTNHVPKDSEGKLKVYRSAFRLLNGLFHIFLIIWFILGCIWVYGNHSEVQFQHKENDEYCHKTLYYFSFWVLNLSFILLGLVACLSMCFLIFVISTDKDDK